MGRFSDRPADAVIVLTAVGFSLLYAGYFLSVRSVADATDRQAFFEMTLFGVAVVALYGSAWLAVNTDASARFHRRLLGWGIAGAVLLVGLDVALLAVVSPVPDFEDQLLLVVLSGGIGTTAGLLMGVFELQAIRQERARARSDALADRREEERQRLEVLNQYLRHEVLNKMQVIELNATIVGDALDEDHPQAERVETIAHRSRDIGQFIQSIRSILQAADHEPTLEPVDVTTVVSEEAATVQRSFESVTVDVDLPEELYVEADSLLSTVVSNLLENAAEHGANRVTVTADVADSAVTLTISDDGPGIPEDVRPTLFDPPESGDHGYGLFLTKNLVELYGGRLRLADTGPEGTTFTLSLSRATEEDHGWERTAVKAA